MNFQAVIVDDDDIFNMLSRKMIQKCGFHPEPKTFLNGRLAVEYFKETYSDNQTYVIFLDINMPVMDGWEFLESIESFAHPDNMLIFMVTSSTDEEDINRANSNKYVLKYLAKPVLSDDLRDLMKHPKLAPYFVNA